MKHSLPILAVIGILGCAPNELAAQSTAPFELKGTVTRADGSPFANGTVKLNFVHGVSGRQTIETSTDATGAFAFAERFPRMFEVTEANLLVENENGSRLEQEVVKIIYNRQSVPALKFVDLKASTEGASAGVFEYTWNAPASHVNDFSVVVTQAGDPVWTQTTKETRVQLPAYVFDANLAYQVSVVGVEAGAEQQPRAVSNILEFKTGPDVAKDKTPIVSVVDHLGQSQPGLFNGTYQVASDIRIPAESVRSSAWLTVDLGEVQPLKSLLVYKLMYSGEEVHVFASERSAQPEGAPVAVINKQAGDFDVPLNGVKARYLHLQLKTGKIMEKICAGQEYAKPESCRYRFTSTEFRVIKAQ